MCERRAMGTWLGDLLAASNDPLTPNFAPARVVGTSFQPSLTGWTLCMYTIQQSQTTTQDGTVTLSTGPADPPVNAWGSCRVSNANAATHVERRQMVCVVPPGHFVKLVATGSGTVTIIEQVEIVIS